MGQPKAKQYGFGRTDAGERGLDQVDSDEDGQPDPVGMHEACQSETQQDHRACEDADGVFSFHGVWVGAVF